jgi:hypothetical protein
MARIKKTGLDYFPVDVHIFSDKKVRLIAAQHGSDGVLIYMHLLAHIYKMGYYCPWQADDVLLFVQDAFGAFTADTVRIVVADCLNRGLFDKKVFQAQAVLTSKGIQERYTHICKQLKRRVEISADYDCSGGFRETLGGFPEKQGIIPETTEHIPEETPIIPDLNPQKKGKEKKRKERVWRETTVENQDWLNDVVNHYGFTRDELPAVVAVCDEYIKSADLSGKLDRYEVTSLTGWMMEKLLSEKQKLNAKFKTIRGVAKGANTLEYGKIELENGAE